MRAAVAVMSRLPVPGRTKTRLMPWLTGEECAEFHRRCLQDVCTAVRLSGLPGYICYHGDPRLSSDRAHQVGQMLGLSREDSIHFKLVPQEGDDLGERMLRASRVVLASWPAVLLVGSDVPDLELDILLEASERLEHRDLVLGPARDGGYYLLGMKAPHATLFKGIDWGTSGVLQETVRIADGEGLSWALLETKSDIDTWEDLVNFCATVTEGQSGQRRGLSSCAYAAGLVAQRKQCGRKEKASER